MDLPMLGRLAVWMPASDLTHADERGMVVLFWISMAYFAKYITVAALWVPLVSKTEMTLLML